LCPPHGVDIEAEVGGGLLRGCSAVELAGDGFGRDTADRGHPETDQRVDPDRRDRILLKRYVARQVYPHLRAAAG
jgi:hypothetical protein